MPRLWLGTLFSSHMPVKRLLLVLRLVYDTAMYRYTAVPGILELQMVSPATYLLYIYLSHTHAPRCCCCCLCDSCIASLLQAVFRLPQHVIGLMDRETDPGCGVVVPMSLACRAPEVCFFNRCAHRPNRCAHRPKSQSNAVS